MVITNANIPRVSIEVQMGIITGKTVVVLYRGFGLHLQMIASPKNKF